MSRPADLSSYVPKHSVDFSAWQERKHEDSLKQEDAAAAQQTQTTEEVMVREPAHSQMFTVKFKGLRMGSISRASYVFIICEKFKMKKKNKMNKAEEPQIRGAAESGSFIFDRLSQNP